LADSHKATVPSSISAAVRSAGRPASRDGQRAAARVAGDVDAVEAMVMNTPDDGAAREREAGGRAAVSRLTKTAAA
jgi:hypothetical protein